MSLKYIKNQLIKHENLGLIFAEIANPTIIGDVLDHEAHHLKRIFLKDFINNQDESLLNEMKHFAKDTIDGLKSDAKGLKSIICYHKKHPDMLKKFVEESLVEDGLEKLATAGIVTVVAAESLPETVGVYFLSKAFRALALKGFGDKLGNLRQKVFGGNNDHPPLKP